MCRVSVLIQRSAEIVSILQISAWLSALSFAAEPSWNVPVPARDRILLDNDWKFQPGDAPGAEQPSFNDSGWRSVHLPHDWSIETAPEPDAPCQGHGGFFRMGIGWYRRTLMAPESWRTRCVRIHFEGVYCNADLWINGHKIGFHPYGYTPFSYDIKPFLEFGAENPIAIRVDNSRQPNCRWYSGSGIYRHVWLLVTDPLHVVEPAISIKTPEATPATARIDLQAVIRNASQTPQSGSFEIQILDPDQQEVTNASHAFTISADAESTVEKILTIENPQRWSPATPFLYRAVFRIVTNGRMADRVKTNFGIRTIEVSANRGFQLNGEPIQLFGGNVHHDNGPLGAAAWNCAEERRVAILKAAGFNAIRTSHNPPSEAFLNACDREGVLVIDEFFDVWAKKKTDHDYSEHFHESWRQDLDAIILRDRNHPSVVLWSIGNEVYERGAVSGQQLAKEMAERVRNLDPTRPITAGMNGLGKDRDWPELDPLFESLDVAGYNYELHRCQADHQRLPARVIVSTESFPMDAFPSWLAVTEHHYVIGDFVWSAMDYLGEAGIGRAFHPDETAAAHWEGSHFPWHGAVCGDIDITGWRKPISHYRNIVWDRGEKLYATVRIPTPDGREWNLSPWAVPPSLPCWTWPGHQGQKLEVEVYSRWDSVRLVLNGRFLGERPTNRQNQYRASFTVDYEPGQLQVFGLHNGESVEEKTLVTVSEAAQIHLSPDRKIMVANRQDLAFVTVHITDEKSRRCYQSNHLVKYRVTGPGQIVAIGNGDLASRQSYQANPRPVHQGRSIVIIRTTNQPGRIMLEATAPGLKKAQLDLQSIPNH